MSDWDDYAADWDDNPGVGLYAQRAFASLEGVADLRGKRVLDFGCGTGLLSHALAPLARELVALDSSAAMIEALRAKQLPKVAAVVSELSSELVATHPAFAAPFDAVVASSVCSFLPNYPEVAAIIRERLVPGGVFVHWDWLSDEDEPGGMTRARVEQTLRAAGFASVELTTPFGLDSPRGELTVLMAIARS
ncbi:methyltransferase, putative [Plesiocystis pacifica SIR-1]|uniref:Methyltransferase, putative n=1 Tax=Plesiocystis pacifica SIR-1 TaxID=391625 RepID=A6G643_9BACT|nr:class I SAM-dependent methyltransferase [Plesiocystis pacifica]EDM78645.1 methyltransferase, putative [Plesiocystis pacifica SIR-1]